VLFETETSAVPDSSQATLLRNGPSTAPGSLYL